MLELQEPEAKLRLNELLDQAEHGEEVKIIRSNGKRFAITFEPEPQKTREAFARWNELTRDLRGRATLEEIRQWVNEDRP